MSPPLRDRLRVAAYCRVSTDKEDQLHSLAAQRAYFTQYIQAQPGWVAAGIFADEGLSGTSVSHRPQFHRMLQQAEAGQIDLILTKEVSRFARNTVDTLRITRDLKARGVGVLFLNDNIDTRDNDGEFRLTIMASVAQEESRKISQRTRWGQAQAMKRGVVFGNDSLFGYLLSGGRLTVIPEQAAIVRGIYHKFLEERKGTYVIARELTEAGIDPPLHPGHPWSSTAVLRILRNEKYAGDLLQQKYCTLDYLSHRKVPNEGHLPQVLLQDHHEAIVPRETFLAVQEELARRHGLAQEGKRFSARHWYSGKVRCGCCGKNFTVKTTKGRNGKVYRRFVCRGAYASKGPTGRCTMRSVNGQWIELCARHVLAQLSLDREAILAGTLAQLQAHPVLSNPAQGERAEKLHHAIQRQTNRRARALDAYLDGALPKEEWQRQDARCQQILQQLEDQKALAETQAAPADPSPLEAQALQARLEAELDGGPWVLDEVIETILVREEDFLVYLQDAPFCFQVRIDSRGSGRGYQVFVASCTPVPAPPREAPRGCP